MRITDAEKEKITSALAWVKKCCEPPQIRAGRAESGPDHIQRLSETDRHRCPDIESKIRQVFRDIDTDNNGYIAKEEFVNKMKRFCGAEGHYSETFQSVLDQSVPDEDTSTLDRAAGLSYRRFHDFIHKGTHTATVSAWAINACRSAHD